MLDEMLSNPNTVGPYPPQEKQRSKPTMLPQPHLPCLQQHQLTTTNASPLIVNGFELSLSCIWWCTKTFPQVNETTCQSCMESRNVSENISRSAFLIGRDV